MSIWDDIAGQAPEESTPFEDLPPNKWFIFKTATEENGGARPRIKMVGKDEDIPQFNVGLIAVGGEADQKPESARGRYVFFSAFPAPGEKELEHDRNKLLSGRFTGFLNAVFSSGVGDENLPDKGDSPEVKKAKAAERRDSRWKSTVAKLAAVAEEEGYTLDQFDGQLPQFIAGAAVAALDRKAYHVLCKTNQRSYTKDGEKKMAPVEAGTVEDYTSANVEKRKVVMFPDPEGAEELGGSAAAPPKASSDIPKF